MLKVISHYLPTHALQQALFDAGALFAVVLAAIAVNDVHEGLGWLGCIPFAVIFAVSMVVLNAAMGLY